MHMFSVDHLMLCIPLRRNFKRVCINRMMSNEN